ncbi:histone-lysine N-methyltransferase ASHR1 [Eurytemora carolleeae]|uniref:histone-lysine N-methyltransferase ASHR1 n=1 Tax=Eurytemora carolleeae TaxID=1294199 RepID=UPI000C78B0CB|nr:histone-lysine N-methyltransferase ASHR1 [Eurytemora carolleeae]|eukprot:XP_023325963.1 histone-lysine N-methyltransferase ASHR1-like [Eurytemora affinis]
MTVRASRNIEEGEDITHTYVDPLDPVLIRQELLNLGKFFHCQCPRCSDPTELKTYSSAMVCPKCKKGYLLPSDVTSTSADWKCNNCEVKMDPVKISRVSNAVKDHAEKLEYNPKSPDECSIPAHEAFLRKYGQVLHSNHVIMISVKYSLAKMYGRMLGYEATTLTDAQLKRKLELCEQVLDVFNIILPGNNRMRGVMLYELHLPLVMLANRSLDKGPGSGVNPKSIKAGLKKGLESLKSGLAILKLEPEGSFEAKIVEGSKDSVAELEDWVNTVSKAL